VGVVTGRGGRDHGRGRVGVSVLVPPLGRHVVAGRDGRDGRGAGIGVGGGRLHQRLERLLVGRLVAVDAVRHGHHALELQHRWGWAMGEGDERGERQ
jgi:hypothetical protein